MLAAVDIDATIVSMLEQGVTTGPAMAAATGLSLRSIYRHIVKLRASGVPIEGERGYGYALMPRRQSLRSVCSQNREAVAGD